MNSFVTKISIKAKNLEELVKLQVKTNIINNNTQFDYDIKKIDKNWYAFFDANIQMYKKVDDAIS